MLLFFLHQPKSLCFFAWFICWFVWITKLWIPLSKEACCVVRCRKWFNIGKTKEFMYSIDYYGTEENCPPKSHNDGITNLYKILPQKNHNWKSIGRG